MQNVAQTQQRARVFPVDVRQNVVERSDRTSRRREFARIGRTRAVQPDRLQPGRRRTRDIGRRVVPNVPDALGREREGGSKRFEGLRRGLRRADVFRYEYGSGKAGARRLPLRDRAPTAAEDRRRHAQRCDSIQERARFGLDPNDAGGVRGSDLTKASDDDRERERFAQELRDRAYQRAGQASCSARPAGKRPSASRSARGSLNDASRCVARPQSNSRNASVRGDPRSSGFRRGQNRSLSLQQVPTGRKMTWRPSPSHPVKA
jgi:hypothetical protein